MITIDVGPTHSKIIAKTPEGYTRLSSVISYLSKQEYKFAQGAGRFIPTKVIRFIDEDDKFRTGLIDLILSLIFGPPDVGVSVRITSPRFSTTITRGSEISDSLDLLFSRNANLEPSENRDLPIEYRAHLLGAIQAFQNRPRGIWDCAVNAGKTFMSAALCARFPGARILVTVPYGNSGLAVQGSDNYKVDCKLKDVGLVKGTDLLRNRVVWASPATITSKLKKERKRTIKWLESFDILIKDECHENSDAEIEIYDLMTCWARLGMSGTPYIKAPIRDLTTQGLFCSTIYKVSNSYLVENGFSAKPFVYSYKVYHKDDIKFPDYISYTKHLVLSPWRVELVRSLAEALHSRGYRVVISCNTVQEAEIYKRSLSQVGPTDIYTGRLKIKERKDFLRRFRNGSLMFLIGTKVFATGVSENSISALILASGSKKSSIQLQKIGRGLRRKDGTNRIVLVDLWDHLAWGEKQGAHRYTVWKSDKAFNVSVVSSLEEFNTKLEEDGN